LDLLGRLVSLKDFLLWSLRRFNLGFYVLAFPPTCHTYSLTHIEAILWTFKQKKAAWLKFWNRCSLSRSSRYFFNCLRNLLMSRSPALLNPVNKPPH